MWARAQWRRIASALFVAARRILGFMRSLGGQRRLESVWNEETRRAHCCFAKRHSGGEKAGRKKSGIRVGKEGSEADAPVARKLQANSATTLVPRACKWDEFQSKGQRKWSAIKAGHTLRAYYERKAICREQNNMRRDELLHGRRDTPSKRARIQWENGSFNLKCKDFNNEHHQSINR